VLLDVRSAVSFAFKLSRYFLFCPELYRKALELCRFNRYDYILCDYGLSGVYGLLLSRRFGVPFIYCSHNLEHRMYWGKSKKDYRRLVFLPYVYLIERLSVRNAWLTVAISRDDAKFYRSWTRAERIMVIPQGFDPYVFYPKPAEAPRIPGTVLFCGNLKLGPNQQALSIILEHILPRVVRSHPDVLFKIVGANPPSASSHANLEFTGFVEDYPGMLREADVVISPLKQGWGFPTKIVEALASGKPTVATRIGARTIETDFAALMIRTIEQFPDTICQILDKGFVPSKDDVIKLRNRYSWSANLERLIRFMNRTQQERVEYEQENR